MYYRYREEYKMRIALVDDEPILLNILKDTLTFSLAELSIEAEYVGIYNSGEAFLADFEANKYDIIILDIYMRGMTGIEVARRIREKDTEVSLAFCTSSNEFAYETYEVEAKYYLNKPVSQEKVAAMLRRFNLASLERNRSVRMPDGSRIPLCLIIFTEYNNHNVTFHIKDIPPRGFYMTQGDAEALLLPHKGFYVINKGCIVNFAQVRVLESGAFVMQNGENVPIARRRYKEIEAAYTQYLFDKMLKEVSD